MEIFEFKEFCADPAPEGFGWCIGEFNFFSPDSMDGTSVLCSFTTIQVKLLVEAAEIDRLLNGGVPLISTYRQLVEIS